MKSNRDIAYPLAKRITEVAVNFEIKGEPRQFTTQIDPIISNTMYARKKELLAHERLMTIIKLTQVLDTEILLRAIEGLEYEVIIKTNK